jgi:hypothetical protein
MLTRRDLIRTAASLAALPAAAATAGFRPLFNGRNLEEWIVDTPSVWTVKHGVIIGKSPGLRYNEFLRTRRDYANFVLRATFRLIDGKGNSGVQFRSKPVAGSHEVSGYQADAGQRYWGSLYDESRRKKTLAGPGEDFLNKLDPAAWHKYVITADGPHIKLELDGVTTVDYVEKEPGIEATGFIALQVHSDKQPVEIQFKDLSIKVLA